MERRLRLILHGCSPYFLVWLPLHSLRLIAPRLDTDWVPVPWLSQALMDMGPA